MRRGKGGVPLALLIGALAWAPQAQAADPVDFGIDELPVDNQPADVAAADFNGDGRPDLAVVNENVDTVSILLGSGGGAFGGATPYDVGDAPIAVTAGDIDGDGALDVITLNKIGQNLSFLYGNGDGTFETPFVPFATTNTGQVGGEIQARSLNGDQYADLVFTEVFTQTQPGSAGVVLGNDTRMYTRTDYALSVVPTSVALGDLNGDTYPDLIVGQQGCPSPICMPAVSASFAILLGSALGTFGSPTTVNEPSPVRGVALGHLDPGSNLDLVLATDAGIKVRLGAGNGSFGSETSYASGTSPTSVTMGDFEGDADQDLAFTGSSNNVYIGLGAGDGTFASPLAFVGHGSPRSVSTAEVSGDTKIDLVAVLNSEDEALVLRNSTGVPPETQIDLGPSGANVGPDVAFEFSADEPSEFKCSLDQGAPIYLPCTSPQAYGPLVNATYTFRVRATDREGLTDATPATRQFTVGPAQPDGTGSGGGSPPAGTGAPPSDLTTAKKRCKRKHKRNATKRKKCVRRATGKASRQR